jgi:outer membrane lipoprotein
MIRPRCSPIIFVPCLVALFVTAGCAPPFPKETLDKVNRTISFQELKKEPEKFKGTLVMLGGMIVASKNTKEGTLIEILQKPLDAVGRPLQTDSTEGRFIVQSDTFLDSAVYHEGRLITVVAEVIGRKELPLDDIMYPYPLLLMKDPHLWDPSQGPRFFFGIGVSHRL